MKNTNRKIPAASPSRFALFLAVAGFAGLLSLLVVARVFAAHVIGGADVKGDLDPEPGPAANNTGNRNQNIYADTLMVAP